MSVDWCGAGGRELRPHGIDVAQLADGSVFLFAINHPPNRKKRDHEILAFEIAGRTLRFDPQRSLRHDLLVSPNDLSALPAGSLFITNWRGKEPTFFGMLKVLFGLNYGNLVHVDTATRKARVVFEAPVPNGVLADPNARRLLLAASGGNELYLLEFDPVDGTVNHEPVSKIRIAAPDNVTPVPGETDTVLVASHPDLLRLFLHSRHPRFASPSRVCHIRYTGRTEVSAVFEDDGRRLSAASAGLIYEGCLYLGQVLGAGVCRCRLG
jgi:hypothetical protein